MKTIELQLSIEETNQILDALGQMPFVKVFELIQKIQTQAAQQLEQGSGQIANGLKPEDNTSKG